MGGCADQTPLSARLDLEMQLRYKAPSDLQVKIIETQWLKLAECGCALDNGHYVGNEVSH